MNTVLLTLHILGAIITLSSCAYLLVSGKTRLGRFSNPSFLLMALALFETFSGIGLWLTNSQSSSLEVCVRFSIYLAFLVVTEFVLLSRKGVLVQNWYKPAFIYAGQLLIFVSLVN